MGVGTVAVLVFAVPVFGAPVLAAVSVELTVAPAKTPVVAAGVNKALPADWVVPDPAPEDEPAVFDGVAEGVLLVWEDWM